MTKSMIYTRSGDKGMTSLVGGTRIEKWDPQIEAYGTVDELNSFIGLLISELLTDASEETDQISELLLDVQSKLFSVGAFLASDFQKPNIQSSVTEEDIAVLEAAIDKIDGLLPKLKSFVLPGGSKAASLAHVCRSVCRRAERAVLRARHCDFSPSSHCDFSSSRHCEERSNPVQTPEPSASESFSSNKNNETEIYLNRLSDLLFVIARRLCLLQNRSEFFWNNPCK